ncbi:hypothetical protein LAZ67_3001708 [Cordylochernes scorpioides]|uniref:Uncharacterized protein n=1 Tax=Cordylochernes scorpioides TaxID=51811 RepID=A0ABY6K7Z5_9ARAC|nr:hypothetical protein LAZ67_3001708 [Cordylochernes scorpioides]
MEYKRCSSCFPGVLTGYFQPGQLNPVEEEIVSLGKSMGLEVEERDVNELIEEHTQELKTEEIQELQSQKHTEVMQVIGFEESEEEVISTSEIKEILGIRAYRVFDITARVILETADIHFRENNNVISEEKQSDNNTDTGTYFFIQEDEQLDNHVLSDVDIEEPAPDTMINRQTESSGSDRPQRTRTIPKRFDDYVLATTNETIPKDYDECIACEDKKHWENAMLEEIQNMYSHQLRGTIDLGVKFERGKTGILKSYTDVSWSTTHDGKSYGGYVLKLGEATIDWKSSKQPLVALSTMEAEMIAACESCCQIKWIINLLQELEEWNFMEKPTAIYTDSQSLINWISSPKQSSRCRHINRKYHFLRDCYESRDICLLYKPSQDLEADIFTKDLSRDQMKKHLENLSIVGIKTKFFGHIALRREMEYTVLTGKMSGRRIPRRPPIRSLDQLKEFTDLTAAEMVHRAQDRDGWCRIGIGYVHHPPQQPAVSWALDSAQQQAYPVAELDERWTPTFDFPRSIPWADLHCNCLSGHDADIALRLIFHVLPHPDHPV